jgi:hypothetical protein
MMQISQIAQTRDDGRGNGQTRIVHPQITQTTQSVALSESDESKGLSGASADYTDYADETGTDSPEFRIQKAEFRVAGWKSHHKDTKRIRIIQNSETRNQRAESRIGERAEGNPQTAQWSRRARAELEKRGELVRRDSSLTDQGAKRPSGELFVVRNGQAAFRIQG